MEALHQIVGCVVASKPDAERIDDIVAQMRRERAVVVAKDARRATFVRLSAQDTQLIALACQAVLGQVPPTLRFGFACGARESTPAAQDGPSASRRSMAEAGDLAAGARDGEVLVSAELALVLIEAGFSLRSKKVRLPDGRTVAACSLILGTGAADGGATGTKPSAEGQAGAALGGVFRTLVAQAGEVARRQAELEMRLDARIVRMEARLQALDALEARIVGLHAAASDVERRVAELLVHRQDFEGLKSLCDTLARQIAEGRFDELLGRVDETDGKIALIESRRREVEEVQSRVDAITHMMGDIALNMEVLGERRAEVEHVGERLARLDHTVQEAQNTLRALQRERELAERIEQGLRSLRSRSTTKLA